MATLPPVHLSIVQPAGYVHSLGLVDQARYYRFQFERLGAVVTVAKNRLRSDAVNFVFGAHLGFDPALCRRHSCVFVNFEQLGDGGATLPPQYLELLRRSAVVDYDPANVPAYASDPADVPIAPLLHAPYLGREASAPLEDRPIDLLFVGSVNERRRRWIERIESHGVQVSTFDGPIYGPERDAFIRASKAVLNVHFYESSRFEQARVSHCLSLGTPVISERAPSTRPHRAFEDSVLWLDDDAELDAFFRAGFGTQACFDAMRAGLQRFRRADPAEAYANLLMFAAGFESFDRRRRDRSPWRPTLLNIGSGKDYRPGWLNVDVVERAQPDLLLDLSAPLELPARLPATAGDEVVLEEGSLDAIEANNVLEHVRDLATLMGNALRLLKDGGVMRVEVPYERSPTAWQDPTHVRALNERSWVYYTDWFWYLGWLEHRFELAESTWLDPNLAPCGQADAAFMRVLLRKVETTPRERTIARTMQAELHLPDDDVRAEDRLPAPVAEPTPAAVAEFATALPTGA